jgi:hypothetical protein
MGIVEEILHVPKGQDPGNSVSLLKVNVSIFWIEMLSLGSLSLSSCGKLAVKIATN